MFKNWKTTLAGLCAAVAAAQPHASWSPMVQAVATFLLGAAASDHDQTPGSGNSTPGRATPVILLALVVGLLAILFSGCAYHCSKLYDPNSGKLVARSRTFEFCDAHTALAKEKITTLPATNGAWSPGIAISGLDESSSTTNLNSLLETGIGAAVRAAVQSAK